MCLANTCLLTQFAVQFADDAVVVLHSDGLVADGIVIPYPLRLHASAHSCTDRNGMQLERVLHLSLQRVLLFVRLCITQLLSIPHLAQHHTPNLHHLHQHLHRNLVVVVFTQHILSRDQLHLRLIRLALFPRDRRLSKWDSSVCCAQY